MYPDFIGIGAQKAGTTWLVRNIQSHPQIWTPRLKELHYFDRHIKKSYGLLDSLFGREDSHRNRRRQLGQRLKRHATDLSSRELSWDLNYFLRPPGDGWYASLFKPGQGQICGEITPNYSTLNREEVAHVYSLVPEASIIFLMRNPIERAWSQTMMQYVWADGREFESISDEEFYRHFRRQGAQLRSDYKRTLENWLTFYPETQMFVGFLEDISFYPREMLGRVYDFLNVEAELANPPKEKKIHTRNVDTMPTKMAARLAEIYQEDIERLADTFGGYASFWAYCSRKLLEDTPQERELAYPFWESHLWEEWKADCPEELASGQPKLQSATYAENALHFRR